MRTRAWLLPMVLLGAWSTGCGDAPASTGDAQTPPAAGAAAMKAWLAKGSFRAWHCEAAPHDFGSPSPHGAARVCSNDRVAGHGAGEYAAGAASVVELFDASGNPSGYAVDLHTSAGTKGASWYWYRSDATGATLAGPGDAGSPQDSACVGCHSAAGIGYVGHDFVFVQID